MTEKIGPQSSAKSLQKSYIFNMLNKDNSITNVVKSTMSPDKLHHIKKGETPSICEEALINIQRSFKYLLKDNVMEALYKGEILLAYDPNVRLLPALPFYLAPFNVGGKPQLKAVVMIHLYAEKERHTDYVRIDPKKLYAMLEAAYMALQYQRAPRAFTNQTDVRSIGARIYANMMTRVLNRKFSINSDRMVLQKVQFLAAKFYLVNQLGLAADSDLVKSYAMQAAQNHNEVILTQLHNDTLNSDDFKDITTFVDILVDPDLHLKFGDKLNIRGLVAEFTTMFDATILLGIELPTYFFYNIFSAVQGAFVNNQYALDNILEKDGVKLHNSISRMLKDW